MVPRAGGTTWSSSGTSPATQGFRTQPRTSWRRSRRLRWWTPSRGARAGARWTSTRTRVLFRPTPKPKKAQTGKLGSAFGSWPARRSTRKSGERRRRRKKNAGGAGGFLDAQLAPDLDPGLRSEARAAALSVQRDNPLALALPRTIPRGHSPQRRRRRRGPSRSAATKSRRCARSCPTPRSGRWPEPTSREASRRSRRLARSAAGSRPGCTTCSGKRTTTRRTSPWPAAAERPAVVPALALVASEGASRRGGVPELQAEHARGAPGWYHPVDAEEDKRRWASD